MTTKEIGDIGETAACKYLEDLDYDIIKRNYRVKFGEIDIIAKQEDCYVFAEVKTRKNNRFGEPSEFVDFRKQQRLRRAAMCFIDTVNNEMRFDIIEVFYENSYQNIKITSINHIENAF